jgi:carbon starvation protein
MKQWRLRYAWITLLPLSWLIVVTYSAAWQKIFSDQPRIGFLAQARALEAGPMTAATKQLIFNNRLDAVVAAAFVVLVTTILIDSLIVWTGILRGTRERRSTETPFVLTQLRAEEL